MQRIQTAMIFQEKFISDYIIVTGIDFATFSSFHSQFTHIRRNENLNFIRQLFARNFDNILILSKYCQIILFLLKNVPEIYRATYIGGYRKFD